MAALILWIGCAVPGLAVTATVSIPLGEAEAGLATELVVEARGEFQSFLLEDGRPILRARKGELDLATTGFRASIAPGRPGSLRSQAVSFTLDRSGVCREIVLQLDLARDDAAPARSVRVAIDLIVEVAYTSGRIASLTIEELRAATQSDGIHYTFDIQFDVSGVGEGTVSWVVLRQLVHDSAGRELRLVTPFRDVFERPQPGNAPRALRGLEVVVPPDIAARGEMTYHAVAIGVTDRGLLVVENVRFPLRPPA